MFFIIGKICAPYKKIPPYPFLDRLTDDRFELLWCRCKFNNRFPFDVSWMIFDINILYFR